MEEKKKARSMKRRRKRWRPKGMVVLLTKNNETI
jgi:hypothetical protein